MDLYRESMSQADSHVLQVPDNETTTTRRNGDVNGNRRRKKERCSKDGEDNGLIVNINVSTVVGGAESRATSFCCLNVNIYAFFVLDS